MDLPIQKLWLSRVFCKHWPERKFPQNGLMIIPTEWVLNHWHHSTYHGSRNCLHGAFHVTWLACLAAGSVAVFSWTKGWCLVEDYLTIGTNCTVDLQQLETSSNPEKFYQKWSQMMAKYLDLSGIPINSNWVFDANPSRGKRSPTPIMAQQNSLFPEHTQIYRYQLYKAKGNILTTTGWGFNNLAAKCVNSCKFWKLLRHQRSFQLSYYHIWSQLCWWYPTQ